MNERTEQLYKEAVNSASAELHEWNKNWRWGNHTNFDYEKVLYKKFAELIVKECADYLDAFNRENMVEEGIGGAELKQHFGVEE